MCYCGVCGVCVFGVVWCGVVCVCVCVCVCGVSVPANLKIIIRNIQLPKKVEISSTPEQQAASEKQIRSNGVHFTRVNTKSYVSLLNNQIFLFSENSI
jgi:hypothetical protein